jgi:hypothetical protein
MIDESHKFRVGEDVIVSHWGLGSGWTHRKCVVSRVSRDLVSVRADGKHLASFRGPERVDIAARIGWARLHLRTTDELKRIEGRGRCQRLLRELSEVDEAEIPASAIPLLKVLFEQALSLLKRSQ